MSSEITYEQAKSYEGHLEKKSRSLIASYQKRYFKIVDGKELVYTHKKSSNKIKAHVNLAGITIPESVEKKVFKFNSEEREFILKAKSEQEKNNWIKALTLVRAKLLEGNPGNIQSGSTNSMNPNVNNINNGVGANDNDNTQNDSRSVSIANQQSLDILQSKGVDQLINIKSSKIRSRTNQGYMYIKLKEEDSFQKKAFFIFSSRPLLNKKYLKDEVDLSVKEQRGWIKFDTLFYFDEGSTNPNSIPLININKIELSDKDNNFFIYLFLENNTIELYTEIKKDRDKWYEALKNSMRTAKEYKASLTKHPRNIELLNSFFNSGSTFYEKIEEEKNAVVGNYNENEEYNIFEDSQKKLGYLIGLTLDGCISNSPPKLDLYKAYVNYMNKCFFIIIKNFWDRTYNEINLCDILNMSMMLFSTDETFKMLKVNDPNFVKYGKELIKIYVKKTNNNILSVIENILSDERESEPLKNEEENYYTNGPSDLFGLLQGTFELIKGHKNKYLYKSILNLFHFLFYQYLLGIETILINSGSLEKQFLLAIANNCTTMPKLINDLEAEIQKINFLTENEIKLYLKKENMIKAIEQCKKISEGYAENGKKPETAILNMYDFDYGEIKENNDDDEKKYIIKLPIIENIICDYFKCPDMKKDVYYMRNKVLEDLKRSKNFIGKK